MNSGNKYACLAAAPLANEACNASQITRKSYQGSNVFQQINLFTTVKNDPSFARSYSNYLIYSRYELKANQEFLCSINNKPGASETTKKKSEMKVLLKNATLTHIDFPDLKIVIGAYRNISYLKRDF